MDLHRVAWLCTFFCFAQVWSLPTNCILKKSLMMRSYTVLETAGGLFPSQCLDERVSVSFPKSVFEYNAQQVTAVQKAIHQTLQNIDALFEDFGDPDQWNAQKMFEFRTVIYRLVKDSECIMDKSEEASDFPSRNASLKDYFNTMSSTLKEKGSSYCAWEIVRYEILQTLDFILKHDSDVML